MRNMDPDDILIDAVRGALVDVIVIGRDADGDLYVTSSCDTDTALALTEKFIELVESGAWK